MRNHSYAVGRIEQSWTRLMAITDDDKAFFLRLGTRISELRRAADITQVQMAEVLGVSQQTVNAYEKASRRVPVSALPTIARALAVSIEELIGEETRPSKRGPTPKLLQQLERITQLPKPQQKFVMQMLDTVLAQASR